MSIIKYFNLDKLGRAKAMCKQGGGDSEEKVLATYIRLGGRYESSLEEELPAPPKKSRSKNK